MSSIDLDDLFTYHRPSADEQRRLERINEAAKEFARVVLDNTPEGADQSCAIRHIRDARMTANASIVCGNPPQSKDLIWSCDAAAECVEYSGVIDGAHVFMAQAKDGVRVFTVRALIDASTEPYADKVKATIQVVDYAPNRGHITRSYSVERNSEDCAHWLRPLLRSIRKQAQAMDF